MIVQREVIEMYTDFIEKTLGNKRGYSPIQRQEILANFSLVRVFDLESLRDRLTKILKEGETISDFSLKDTQDLLSNTSEKIDNKQIKKTHRELKNNLLVIPESLHQQIFGITEVMASFKHKYPEIVNFEHFGWLLKKLIKNLFPLNQRMNVQLEESIPLDGCSKIGDMQTLVNKYINSQKWEEGIKWIKNNFLK